MRWPSEASPATPLLTVTDLTVRYGGVVALESVSLTVPEGRLVGLIGPNGAGKTTFVDAMTGFAPYTGEMRFDGTRLDRQPPHVRARHGLARTFQSGGVFDDLTVEENILIGERSGAGALSAVRAVLTGHSPPRGPSYPADHRLAPADQPAGHAGRGAQRRTAQAGVRGPGAGQQAQAGADGRARGRAGLDRECLAGQAAAGHPGLRRDHPARRSRHGPGRRACATRLSCWTSGR